MFPAIEIQAAEPKTMSTWVIMLLLLVAFLAALFVAPFIDRRGKVPEVGLTRWIAIAYVVVSCGTTLYGLVEIAVSPSLKIDMPIREFWPKLPGNAGVEGPTAQVVSGGVTHALVEVQGLAIGTRWLLGTGVLLQGIVAIFIGAAVISMCNGYLKKITFRPVLVKWFSATALVVVVCGMGWQIVGEIAGMQASAQVLGASGSHWNAIDAGRESLNEIFGQPEASEFSLSVNFWPLWAGLGLFTTAPIFKRGLDMQKDAVGLI